MYDDLNLEEEEEMYNVGIEEHFINEEEKSKKSKEKDDLDDVSSPSSSTRTNNKTVTSSSPTSCKPLFICTTLFWLI